MDEAWSDRFPGVAQLPAEIRKRLAAESGVVRIAEGARIFGPGRTPSHFLLLLEGTVRVQQVSEGGREIVLYRIAGGESCVLTTACLLGYEDYRAEGIAETNVEAAAIPRATFDELIAQSTLFRLFVFASFSARITDLCRVIDDIAFTRLDTRLAQKLLQLKDSHAEVSMTHQQLATELGSAREVVSRQVHEFQRRGWIRSSRGLIAIVDEDALRRLSDPPLV